ncbi:MAG: GNAT family N-acetyltransferase [Limosilactobacillus sp.]|uniref:GNAT family N-acetyltransferase n=1 Tax=Limosilactobacillus sp. TaxID=2773925 RepID=UPI0026F4D92B|nr:GNAT family N-acetyltransferase [Limosilactobacillus sp.]
MADEVTLKLAGAEDAAGLLKFLRQASTESDAILIPYLDQITVEREAQDLANIQENPDSLMLLAKLGEETIGVLTIMVMPEFESRGELGVVVGKDYWHNGIGSLLVDESLYWFDNFCPLEELYLDVYADNLNAIKLYQKFGFTEIGRTTDQEGRKLIQMTYEHN